MGSVEFRDVSFGYPGSTVQTVRNVSFKVEAGQTLAIIGPTGCGKSPVAKLMQRIYDVDSGQILVDGIDVRDYSREALEKVHEDIELFAKKEGLTAHANSIAVRFE